jgi:putative CRISPR-associated protein (TIGR02620 family)
MGITQERIVVVTRHQGTIDYLREQGYIEPTDPIIEHATPEDVRGAHVIGMLPYHLAALARTVTVVDLDVPQELRGVDLDAAQVARYSAGIRTYRVSVALPRRVRF